MGLISNIHHGYKRPTQEAMLLRRELERHGVEVIHEYFDGHKHIDLRIPDAKLDIEVDGILHLTDPKQIITDLNREYHSSREGVATIHIPNDMVKKHLVKIASALAQVAKTREKERSVHIIMKSSEIQKQKSDMYVILRDSKL